jgi:dihydropteroate synthase
MTTVPATPLHWRTPRGSISLDSPVVMGVLNITPDSFSDGGDLATPAAALERARSMVEAGARILDVGGESTRPGAGTVPPDEELQRVLPVLELLARELPVHLSIDTRKAEVARLALDAGAAVVNDVSGLRHDPAMASVVARSGAGLVLMHMRGTPADMKTHTSYRDLMDDLLSELAESVDRAVEEGVDREALVVDPGIGFAKTPAQSFELLERLGELRALGLPILVGTSRKSFLGALLDLPAQERVTASAVSCALAWERGAKIFRVHDVRETVEALAVARAVVDGFVAPGPAGETDPAFAGGVERWEGEG